MKSNEVVKKYQQAQQADIAPLSHMHTLESADPDSGLDQNNEVFLVPAAGMMREEHCSSGYVLHTLMGFSLTETFVSLSSWRDAAGLSSCCYVAAEKSCLQDK